MLTVFGGLYAAGLQIVAADGNKEQWVCRARMCDSTRSRFETWSVFLYNVHSVHIKVHIPELIKKHTHVRTIYKHHHKAPKPKTKTKHHASKPPPQDVYYEHEYGSSDRRRDPAIRHGTLHSKYQRHQWMDHLVPAASHVHEDRPKAESSSSTSLQEPDILQRWQHNFRLLNSKLPAPKKTPNKSQRGRNKKPVSTTSSRPNIKYHPPVEIPDRTTERPPIESLDFRFFERYKESSDDRNPFIPDTMPSNYGAPSAQKLTAEQHQQPEYDYRTSQTDQSIPTNHSPQHRPTSERYNKHQHRSPVTTAFEAADFKPPRLLKITEEDIRLPSKYAPGRTSSKQGKIRSGQTNQSAASAAAFSVTKRPPKQQIKKPSRPIEIATNWDDYAAKYHPNPKYIHAVAAALRSTRPAVSVDYNKERDAFAYLNGDHGGSTAIALVQQPSAPMASQEEFMPQQQQHRAPPTTSITAHNGGVGNYDTVNYNNHDAEDVYGPSAPEATAFGDGHDVNDGQSGEVEVEQEDDESRELEPFSFDEVPYQTFTKRKNLLRNAHRE